MAFTLTVSHLPGVDPAEGPFRFDLEWRDGTGWVTLPVHARGPESFAVSAGQEAWLFRHHPGLESPAAGNWLTHDRALFDRLAADLAALARAPSHAKLQLLSALRERRAVGPPLDAEGLPAWNARSACTDAERAQARAQDLLDHDALLALAPDEAEPWLLRADRKRTWHLDFEAALADYAQACTRAPGDGTAWWGMGCALLELGRHAEAVPALQRALLASSQAEEVRARRLALAAALQHSGQPEAALEQLARVLRKGGRPGPRRAADAPVHQARARCLAALGRLPEALEAWADASRCRPDESLPHCERARLLGRLPGRAAEALAAAAQGAALARGDEWEPLLLHGCALREQGRTDEARPVLEEALRRRPTDGRTAVELGMLLAQQGAAEEALSLLDAGLDTCPSWPAHLERARLRFRLRGDELGARADLAHVLEASPGHPAATALREEMASSPRRGTSPPPRLPG